MKDLKTIVTDAFYKNRQNFMIEIRRIIVNNEYPVNERTVVTVKGTFNWDDCCPFIQFQISLDEYRLDTEFYRYDFDGRNNSIKMDETEIEDDVVEALQLYEDDMQHY